MSWTNWSNWTNKTKTFLGIVTAIITVAGSGFAVERYFAKSEQVKRLTALMEEHEETFATKQEVASLNKRINLNSLQDFARNLQNKIWDLEDRYKQTNDDRDKRQLNILREQLRRTLDKIDQLERELQQ
jgi:hypothetical protein